MNFKTLLTVLITATFATACSEQQDNQKAGVTDKSDEAPGSGSDAADSPDNWITTASGLKYRIIEQGNGQKAEPGKMVKVHYKGTFTDGKEFDSSYKRGKPISFKLGSGQVIKGWDEGISYLKVGDKAEFYIPSALAYGSQERPGMPANSDLIFVVELVEVSEAVQIKAFDVSNTAEQSSSSGLKYYIVEKTNGTKANPGDVVHVHYTGYLENGKIFDSSLERGVPISFPLGEGKVIKGWDEGLTLMKVGEKARLIIPPHLAYGKKGAGDVIPPDATLIFDVELVGVN